MEKLKFLMSGLWSFLQPIIKVFLSDIGPVLISAATAAVAEMAATDKTGDEKKAAAVAAVTSALTSQGVTVATHLINTTIETAVAKLKADAS